MVGGGGGGNGFFSSPGIADTRFIRSTILQRLRRFYGCEREGRGLGSCRRMGAVTARARDGGGGVECGVPEGEREQEGLGRPLEAKPRLILGLNFFNQEYGY